MIIKLPSDKVGILDHFPIAAIQTLKLEKGTLTLNVMPSKRCKLNQLEEYITKVGGTICTLH